MNKQHQRPNQPNPQRPSSETRQGSGHSDLPKIEFWADRERKIVNPDLFVSIAYTYSEKISNDDKKKNKRSQIRKFYDEVIHYYDLLKGNKEIFPQLLPYIKLLRAKVYYSLGRGHITDHFKNMIENCLNQIQTYEDFEVFKNFFEAFMGYYRYHRPKDE